MRITPSQKKIVYTLGVGLSDINPALFRYDTGRGGGRDATTITHIESVINLKKSLKI